MLPYLVTSTEDSVALFELSDGRFQMLEQGQVARFALGLKSLIVDRAFAKYLKSLKVPQVTFAPVVILNHTTGEEHRSHMRVIVHRSFSQNEVKSLSFDDRHILVMNGEHFFVSPSLKFALEANVFSFLGFSEGLSAFASAA